MKILQVVGYKDTGKTTVILEFLKILKSLEITVAVIKHHHIDIDASTDTGMFSRYSDVTLMNTPNFVLTHEHKTPNLSEQIEMLSNKVEVILIEGYKNENYDKIVLTHSFSGNKGDIRELDLKNVLKYYNVEKDFNTLKKWFKEWSSK